MARKQNVVMPDSIPEKADGFVMVCLKRPTGIKYALKNGNVIEINGYGIELRGKDMGVLDPEAYGLTMIRKSEWEEIKGVYGKNNRLFEKKIIFSKDDLSSAVDEAKDNAEIRGGLEPIEPNRAHTKGVQASEVI